MQVFSRSGESSSRHFRAGGYGRVSQSGETAAMGNRIREIRLQKGMALREVAERAGTIAQTIAKLEKGTMALNLEWMRQIAAALGVKPADLLTDADNPDRLRDDSERALLADFRDLSPKGRELVLTRASLVRRGERGEITEAEAGFVQEEVWSPDPHKAGRTVRTRSS
jgi:transcriptional regulator with XRE-family HTH domain